MLLRIGGVFVVVFNACTRGIWTFLGQELNLKNSSYLSHCSNDAGSLTGCTKREFLVLFFRFSI